MKIEEIIKKSIDKLNHDIDLRNSLYLNIIHRNIDTLVDNSHKWFGDAVPKEFIEVLNSLINLSIIFGDRARKSTELIFEKSYQEFQPSEILESIKYDFIEMLAFSSFDIKSSGTISIITSKQIFKDSLYHIFFCISQFVNDNSECHVSLYTEHSSEIIDIQYLNLNESMPDIRTLLRLFFPYDTQSNISQITDMNIRVGLNIAVENIKRIGGIIHIDTIGLGSKGLKVRISFPTKELLNTINDVRKYTYIQHDSSHSGTIVLSLLDKMTELLISESLQDAGYDIDIEHITKIKLIKDIEDVTAVIVDYDNIIQNYESVEQFSEQLFEKRIVIIYKKSAYEKEIGANIKCVSFPFEIDSILELIS